MEDLLHRCQMPDPCVELEYRLVKGDVSEQVLRVAAESGCDVIIVGTHARLRSDRTQLGRAAESILRDATCPVVVVSVPDREPSLGNPEPLSVLDAFYTKSL
jgi:nucleotide-binding universal stress UspA family protein